MYSFNADYSEGCHPDILKALTEVNYDQNEAYGLDSHSAEAAEMLRQTVQQPTADVHFLVGGTMTNSIAIDNVLRPCQAVVSTHLGHINVLETGNIERFGHKILTTEGTNGKLTPECINGLLKSNASVHMVKPKMVYITNTTEIGTIYTKAELSELSNFCREHDLYLYMDGARLCCALAAPNNDLSLPDIASMVDMLYIGINKNGALFGEALVIMRDELKHDVRRLIKQHAGLLSKGWLLGLQFKVLLRDDLYLKLADHANRTAKILKDGVLECGYTLWTDSHTNMHFPIFPLHVVEELSRHFAFHTEKVMPYGDAVVRLCTSWATKEEECHRFVDILRSYTANN